MMKRIKIIDESTKQVLTMSEKSNQAWAVQNGFSAELHEVEEGYNGNTYLAGYAPVQSDEELLEIAKRGKITEINTKRDEVEQGGLLFKGNIFDSDQVSFMRLMGASQTAQTALASGQMFSLEWTLQNNEVVTLTAQDLIEIIPAFAIASNAIHTKAKELKEEVDMCTTVECVQSITWSD